MVIKIKIKKIKTKNVENYSQISERLSPLHYESTTPTYVSWTVDLVLYFFSTDK